MLGVVGGMGPLASSAFVQTIYDLCAGRVEQETPALLLYSDPAIPDRTEILLKHEDALLLAALIPILQSLQSLKVSRIIVCCITLHYIFPQLPDELRKSLISLVDIIFSLLLEKKEKHLLFCTTGTMQLHIFQDHPLWDQCAEYIILPSWHDQQYIHELLYQIKGYQNMQKISDEFSSLLRKYQVTSYIAGCTEAHLLMKHLLDSQRYPDRYTCIDPLAAVAQALLEERL